MPEQRAGRQQPTGGSMQRFIEQHAELVALDAMGHLDRAVVFARNPVPAGVVALFQMSQP